MFFSDLDFNYDEVFSLSLNDSELNAIIQKVERGQKQDFNAVLNLISIAEQMFESEPQLIERQTRFTKNLEGIVFVGDTHGDFSSTFAVFSEFDPNNHLIVLLGDYIDRGPFSVRNINYILAQKLLHEKNVIVLRGNHETPLINFNHGFYDELSRAYPKRAFELFEVYNKMFSYIPYSAILEECILAFHGGLAVNLKKHQDINKIRKGDLVPENSTAFQILWNDPHEDILDKSFSQSGRGGSCFYFGKEVVTDFLNKNDLSYIIRAHGPQKEGYHFYFKNTEKQNAKKTLQQNSLSIPRPILGFDGRLLSIYSSKTLNVSDPKVALLTKGKLRIVSLTALCKSRGIKSSKTPLWARQTTWRRREGFI
jgi:protein phosphatase